MLARIHDADVAAARVLPEWLHWGWLLGVDSCLSRCTSSQGWCPFDDIMLAVRRLRTATQGNVSKVLYIDLDAHQGNGVSRDKLHFNDTNFFIVDLFNWCVSPLDSGCACPPAPHPLRPPHAHSQQSIPWGEWEPMLHFTL